MELSTLVSSMLRLGIPLLLASLGVLFSAKSGIVNMGMEGNMLLGAFVAVLATEKTGQPILGLIAAMLSGIIYSLVLSFFIIKGRGNQVVCGLGMNFVVIGMTTVMLDAIWGVSGISAEVPRLPQVILPWIGQQSVISFVVAILAVPSVWFFLSKLNIGLRIRSVGENPAAADSVGVDVIKYQIIAMILAGAFGGLGGAELSIGQMGYFLKQMTASKGFLAYSSVIFASYHPLGVFLATMIIGLLDAFQMRAQMFLNIPGQFLLMLPYIVTLVALLCSGERKKPASAGKTYIRGNF